MTDKPESNVEPLLFNVNQTCARLNIGRSMFYKEVAAGAIETLTIGDRRFTTDEQQREYIARKAQKARAA